MSKKGGIVMAQYQRFLSYLFEYDKDQKKENCGFAKVEVRGDVQRIYLSVMYLDFTARVRAAAACRLAGWS